MMFTVEDTDKGFKLTVESPHAEFTTQHGLTHRRVIEMDGSHNPLAEAYGILERVGLSGGGNGA